MKKDVKMSFPVWIVPVLIAMLRIVIKVLEGNEPESPAHLLDHISTDMVKAISGSGKAKKKTSKTKAPQPQEAKSNG